MGALMQDIRFAVRTLARSPAFAIVAVLTLAVGIGANTAVFSVVKGTLLAPAPYSDTDRLVYMSVHGTKDIRTRDDDLGCSVAEYFDWREQCESYDSIGIHYRYGYNLTGGDRPARVEVIRATASVLSVLGVDATIGRVYGEEEDQPDSPRVALLSDSFWRTYFAGDPDLVGTTIELESTTYTVLGVLPAALEREWGGFDLWAPLRADPANASRGGVGWLPVARLKDGVSLDQAQAEMDIVAARLAEEHVKLNQHGVRLIPFMQTRFGERDETAMLILTAAVGFVLLIACINVANLLLARAEDRRGEFAVRAALGAGRWRLARQTLVEGMALALAGGALGALLAIWGVDIVVAALSDELAAYAIGVDPAVLGFTLLISLATALLFGLAPALSEARVSLTESLKSGARTAVGATSTRGRDVLLIGQVAMAFATLICAGLLARSFVALRGVDPGFNTRGLLTMEVSVDRKKYTGNYFKRVAYFDDVLARIRSAPGVVEAGAAILTPLLDQDHGMGVVVEEYSDPTTGTGEVMVDSVIVTPGYFQAMGIPLLAGRHLNERDVYGAPRALIVSRSAAERFWPGEEALGKRIRYGWSSPDEPWWEVVGVVGDVTQNGLRQGGNIQLYRTMAQGGSYTSHMTIVARTAGDPLASAAAVRGAIAAVDPDQPAFHIRSMNEIVGENTRELAALAGLLGAFSLAALLLATVGLYGVIAFMVGRRTQEIGLRVALGACRPDILRLIMTRYVALTLIGLGVGLGMAVLVSRALEPVLYGVGWVDPATIIVTASAMLLIALSACYVPARRATRVDPMVALRYE